MLRLKLTGSLMTLLMAVAGCASTPSAPVSDPVRPAPPAALMQPPPDLLLLLNGIISVSEEESKPSPLK